MVAETRRMCEHNHPGSSQISVQMSRLAESRVQISDLVRGENKQVQVQFKGKSKIENCLINSLQSLPHLMYGVAVRDSTAKFARLKMPLVSSV